MTGYLKRLLTTGAAYQVADAVSKLIALALLPVYTRHLTRADYGTAELLLTTIILVSIIVRAGLGEALVRFHFLDADPDRRRRLPPTPARPPPGVPHPLARDRLAAVALHARRRRVRARRRAALQGAAGLLPPGRAARGRARAVGVHEP